MLKSENNNSKTKIFLGGALIGAFIFLLIYGFNMLNVTYDDLIINGYIEKDIAQHYAGWMLFRNSPWEFPLGVGQNIAYPYGSAVSYTDSIPLFAIFFKLFRSILPETFQYFGIFVFMCFMLQGAFASLLSNLFSKNLFINYACAMMFSFSPVMIERAFRHCGLTAHFLILAALYYYFKNKGDFSLKAVVPFFTINALAITIHPYFLPFTFGIMFAYCIEGFVLNKQYIKSILYILSSIVVTLFVGYVIGAFYISGPMATIGYGLFSMNLNALHNPISRGFSNWSTVLEIKPHATYQIEGFNYLGLGIILFIPIAGIIYLAVYKKGIIKIVLNFIKNYFGIIFSTLCLLIFALGDWVTFGGLKLFRLPIPDFLLNSICGIFRANGRFGWLLVYMIMLFIIFALSKLNIKLSSIFICLLIGIQVFDMRGVLASKHAYFNCSKGDLQGQVFIPKLHNTFWDKAAEKYEFVHIITKEPDLRNIEIAVKFAKNNHLVNANFEARNSIDSSEKEKSKRIKELESGTLNENTLVITDEPDIEFMNLIRKNKYSVFKVDNLYAICSSKFSEEEILGFESHEYFEIIA